MSFFCSDCGVSFSVKTSLMSHKRHYCRSRSKRFKKSEEVVDRNVLKEGDTTIFSNAPPESNNEGDIPHDIDPDDPVVFCFHQERYLRYSNLSLIDTKAQRSYTEWKHSTKGFR